MAKSLKSSSEQSAVQIQKNNPGCMWGMFHILDYHHWRVKKVFHHKNKRHARYKRNTISHDKQKDVVAEAEPLLVNQHGEKLNATATGECALHLEKDDKTAEGSLKTKKLSRDISVKLKKNSDVLEIINVEKNLLLKFLQDIDNGGNKNRRASRNKARLTKSGTFPLTASSSSSSSSSLRHKQNEIWAFPKGEKFLVGTQAPRKFGSNSVKDKKPKPSVTDSAVEQKPSISLNPSEGLNHKGWNHLVIHQFKVIKQKIKHALVEFNKSGHHHTSVELEAINNKASTEYSNDNNEKEISESLDDDDVIREYRKSKSLSETKASDFDSSKHEIRLMRRTSSIHESLDKYTELFEKSFSKEVKWKGSKSKSLRLRSEDKIQKNGHAPVFSRSNLSMPNIDFLGFIIHEALLDTVEETDNNDGQKKLVSLSSQIVDPVKEAEIGEKVEGSGRESSLQEKVEISMEEVALSLETSYQDNKTSHAEGRKLNTRDSTSDELDSWPDSLSNTNASVTAKDINKSLENHIQLFKSDIENDSNFKYVKDVLKFSGFMRNEQIEQMRYTAEQPLKPSLFKALEASLNHEKESSREEIINIYDHHQLLFNLVNEVLFEIHEKSPSYFPRPLFLNHQLHPMPKGQYLLKEVWSSVGSYLSLRPELFQTLDDVVSRDLAKRSGWMNMEVQQEEEIVALELEEMIIDDLLDEIVLSAYD